VKSNLGPMVCSQTLGPACKIIAINNTGHGFYLVKSDQKTC